MLITSRGTRHDRVAYPSEWIDHRAYDIDLLSFYTDCRREDLLTTNLLLPQERGEFVRFYDALKLWEYYVPKQEERYDGRFYWINSIERGPEFADWLKDQFAYSYREKFGVRFTQSFPEAFPLQGYNDLFPYQGLLKFKPEVNDYEYSMIESAPPLDDDLEDLKDIMREMIKDIKAIELINDFEITSEVSTSSAFVKETGKTKPHCFIRDHSLGTAMVGKRCVVHVYPGGSRDTVILTKDSSNTIRLIERQMRHILEHIPESAVTLHANTFKDRMNRVKKYSKPAVHFLRDIKKCGLTFPLIHLIDPFVEVLQEAFPSEFWNHFLIYKKRLVTGFPGTDEWVSPPRGYFLGMANHLATFLLIAINRLAEKKFFDQYPDAPVKFRSIIGNDDSDIAIIPKWDTDAYYDQEILLDFAEKFVEEHILTMSSFGVWYNSKKSFLSYESLFYEEYSAPNFHLKQSRYAIAIANCLALPSIRMAKHMLKSFLVSVESLDLITLGPMISYATNILGFEFDENEHKRDYYLGGWIPHRDHFLSNVLFDLVEPEEDIRFLSRIFDYVTSVERLNQPRPHEVTNVSQNVSPLAKAMGITGKPKSSLATIVNTIEGQEKYYHKLLDFERKPKGYENLAKNVWTHVQKKSYSKSVYDLCATIVSKVDCNIPPFFVKEYASNRECDIVNSTWIGYNELDMPNRLIKSLCYEISEGNLSSSLDVPSKDCWKYANFEYKLGLPDYVVDFPFVPIARGEIRKISSDGFASLGAHAVDYGKYPKSLMFALPERDIPEWRTMTDLLRDVVISIEDFEDALAPEESFDEESTAVLNFLGITTLVRNEPPDEEEPEEEKEFISDELPLVEKKTFTVWDWEALSIMPACRSSFVDEPCETHKNRDLKFGDIHTMTIKCLACAIYLEDPHNREYNDSEMVERSALWLSRDKLLKQLGFVEPEESDYSDDEAMDIFG